MQDVAEPAHPRSDQRSGLAGWFPVGVVGVVPLVVDPDALLPFLTARWLVLWLLVPAGLAAAGWTVGLRWPLARWWLLWLATVALAALVGVAPWASLAGTPQRNLGVLAWCLAAGSFVLGASWGSSGPAVRSVLRASLVATALVGLVALLESFDVDLFGLGDLDRTSRVRSTWGNASFLGGYLVLTLPLAVVQLRTTDRRWRSVAVAAAALGTTGLVLTASRGAWLGALVAALVVAWPELRTGWRPTARAVAGVVVAAGVALALAAPVLSRSTAVGRLDLWSLALDAVAERPVLGAGPDAQRIVLPARIDAAFERDHASVELHDRAHSLVLDTALTTGVVGTIVFGALVVAAGRRAAAAARQGRVARSLLAGLAGYLVHLCFAFSEATLDPLAWLLVGLLIAIGDDLPVWSPRRASAAGLAIIGVLGVLWSGGEWVADRRAASVVEMSVAGDVIEGLRRAGSTAPARFDIDQARGRAIERSLGSDDEPSPMSVDDGLAAIDEALGVAPGDPELLLDRAGLLVAGGRFDAARRAYEEVLAGPYPASWRAQLGLGTVAASTGDDAEAERRWRRAAALAPTQPQPSENLTLLHEEEGRSVEPAGGRRRPIGSLPPG